MTAPERRTPPEGGAVEIELGSEIVESDSTSRPSVVDLDEEAARDLTTRIRQTSSVLVAMIEKAYAGRIWIALGYESWADWWDTEIGEPLRLDREDRRELVASLRDHGMSIRALATVTGTSVGTVHADVRCSELNTSSEPDEIIDAEHRATLHRRFSSAEGTDGGAHAPGPPPNKVVGLDGKRYKPASAGSSAPTTQRRRRFEKVHSYYKMETDARRLANKLEAVVADDRFNKNRPNRIFLDEARRLLNALAEIIAASEVSDE